MRSKLLAIFIFLLLLACSNENSNPTYPFERTVLDISIAKTCKDCYIMRWKHPIEKKDLQNYYIWLDTTVVKDSVQNISQSQITQASASIAYSSKGESDSLDLTGLVKAFLERDSLHIAIWAKYSGSEKGAVQHLYVHFGDDVPPSVVYFSDSAASKSIWINWVRPTDQRDFYSPEEVSGPIVGYDISVEADKNENIRNATVKASLSGQSINSSDLRLFYKFKKEGHGVVLERDNNQNQSFLRFVILDRKGFASNDIQANNWKMEISGLKPEAHYKITMVAYDSAGNQSKPENRIVSTTDTIPPLIASKFWFYMDSGDGLPRLDSNRLVLFWPRSVDPLESPTPIQLDSSLRIPSNYQKYREVKKYLIEQKNGTDWEPIARDFVVLEDYYNVRYKLEKNSMKLDTNGNGEFISDTLRWVLPGDTITLRIRAVDGSGYYSNAWIQTIVVSKGELWKHKCPKNFVPVKMDSSSVFCMEELQHISEGKFERNILYEKAKQECEDLSFRLCTELEWNAACTAGGSRYGVIEERNFSPDKFLFGYCGVGTGDSISASSIARRSKICANRNGVRDLPGQLQEWVTSKGDSGEVPLLKGSSYAIFEGASRVELAQCKNRFTPTRIRPKYTTDSVYLYRSGSRIDTLLLPDTSRTLFGVLDPSKFTGTILVYSLTDSIGNSLGIDYVNQEEFNKRGGNKWLDIIWQGLKYEGPIEKRQALILGTENVNASKFFLDPTVGFRCCTNIMP